jgi:hypothetical protein
LLVRSKKPVSVTGKNKKYMNQLSSVGFGPDANVYAGYAQSANERLGNIDFVFENTGPNAAYIRLMQYDGQTSPSGFAPIDTTYTTGGFLGFEVAPGGVLTKSYVLISKRVGFFGSGNTTVNISAVMRNKADLRGGDISIVASGRKSWGFDEGFDRATLTKKWGTTTGPASTSSNINAGQGLINPSGNNPPGQGGSW